MRPDELTVERSARKVCRVDAGRELTVKRVGYAFKSKYLVECAQTTCANKSGTAKPVFVS